jgi:hypothetical protein
MSGRSESAAPFGADQRPECAVSRVKQPRFWWMRIHMPALANWSMRGLDVNL